MDTMRPNKERKIRELTEAIATLKDAIATLKADGTQEHAIKEYRIHLAFYEARLSNVQAGVAQ